MLLEFLLLVSSVTSVAPTSSSQHPVVDAPTAQSTADDAKDIGAALVEKLVEICARHPEVERAFLLVQTAPDGSVSYMFVPIFDRKVSDLALSEAQVAYRTLNPSGGYLPMMLMARNQWKKQLGGAPPIYLRPKPVGKS